MLGFVAGAALWGWAKAAAPGAHRKPHTLSQLGFAALAEEVQFRTGLERGIGRSVLGLAPGAARGLSALAFGLSHDGNLFRKADAALGGVIYSLAYDKGGLGLAAATHVAHNLGVWFGSR